jgi:predicted nucleic acid-binding protein
VKAVDTSIVVAAFASWHEHHTAARRVLDTGVRLIDHCALETYSVLTRLPAPHRSPARVVRDFLRARFPSPFLRLGGAGYRAFVLAIADRDITGGAAYDALVAATAAAHDAELVTCDRRAARVYDEYGVAFDVIG